MSKSVLDQLFEASKGKAVRTVLDPSLKGKCFTFFGRSDTGKTSQLCKLPNPVLIPLERGDSALSNVLKLPTRSWSDIESHLNLLKSKQWTKILNDTDEPICRAGIDTDIENGHMDPAGEGWGGTNWETAP